MPQYDINLRDYWRIIRRRKGVIIFTTLLLAFFSFAFSKFNEPVPIYTAVSSVRIERVTSIAGLIMESFAFSPADDLATQQVIIRSFPVMEEVAKELGYIDKSLSSAEVRKSSQLVSIVHSLQGQVRTSLQGATNIIDIKVTSRDPEEAQRLANTIAQKYKEYTFRQRNKQVVDTRKFIEEQLARTEKRLRAAENRVKEFQENNKLLSISAEASAVLSQIARVEGEYERLKEALSEVRLQIKQLEAEKPLEKGGRLYI
ncbi:MAG: GumC family protein, partial [Nitrospinota bacterium]